VALDPGVVRVWGVADQDRLREAVRTAGFGTRDAASA